jgi:uncharacterized protein (DUF305 family)
MVPLGTPRPARSMKWCLVPAFLLLAGACAGSGDEAADTAAAATDTPAAATSTPTSAKDTSMAGMDHSKMAAADRGPAKDADHEFLRMMSDHHEGLVTMMAPAMGRATSADAKADATRLHHKQQQERDQMVGMIQKMYSESLQPMVMPNNKAMNDSLQAKTGPEYDRDMYRHIVMHHREGVQMIDKFLSRLQNADVRSMAEKMRADQTREIAEFDAKAKATR